MLDPTEMYYYTIVFVPLAGTNKWPPKFTSVLTLEKQHNSASYQDSYAVFSQFIK